MSQISGPSDPNQAYSGKIFQNTQETQSSQSNSTQTVTQLQNQIAALAPTALHNTQAQNDSMIEHCQNMYNTINMHNIQSAIDIVNNPSTRSQVQQALEKAGFGSAYFSSNVKQDIANWQACGGAIPKNFTNAAEIINKVIGYTPNPHSNTSMYVPLNLYLQTTAGGIQPTNLGNFSPTTSNLGEGFNYVNEKFQGILATSLEDVNYTPESPCMPCVFPANSYNFGDNIPIEWPQSEENTSTIRNAQQSNATMSDQCNTTLASIQNSLNEISQQNAPLSQAQQSVIEQVQQQISDPEKLTLSNLSDIDAALKGGTGTSF